MISIFSSYLRYARGASGAISPWCVLRVFGYLFSKAVRIRNALFTRGAFASTDPPIPVISVGNLCHGGTNKTPTVELIARWLSERGLSVGIVSRGYGGATRAPLLVDSGGVSSDRSVVGDEPLMLASRLPDVKVVVSRERLAGARLLAELGAEIAVADDAFQHRRMARDVDIVLVDASCPFGNGASFPAGILREPPEALRRADAVVITKADLVSPEEIASLRETLARWVPSERIFTARMVQQEWLRFERGEQTVQSAGPEGRVLIFSAIADPESFARSMRGGGIEVARSVEFRDHHRYDASDIARLDREAESLGAVAFACTEKDLQNMPEGARLSLPLYVPRISVSIDDAPSFWSTIVECLRPRVVVTSNGYGEDAIGALLAARLREKFPCADVAAFALVGSGREYERRGIRVISPPSEMPSGGVIKYSMRELVRDIKHGLGGDIRRQIAAWREMAGRCRTPICVGDVYLLALTVWGQGMRPVLLATAKSELTNGHFCVERSLLRRRARKVWTRDAATAEKLASAGIDAVFAGSPIMDLAEDADTGEDPWRGASGPRVLLLPGSRPRAYDDADLLLSAARLLSEKKDCSYVLVLAPTIDRERLIESVSCEFDGERLVAGRALVKIFDGPIAAAARRADVLIGLGGTANQVSAGMGVPVVSILERGKLAQKKLLRDAETLVPADGASLCEAALEILEDEALRRTMSEAGVRMLGGPGACSAVVRCAEHELGLAARARIFTALQRDNI